MTWGVESSLIERIGAAGVPAERITPVPDTYTFKYLGSPTDFVAAFSNLLGPTMNAFEEAEKNGRAAGLQSSIELFQQQNHSASPDKTSIPAKYLRVGISL
jgi:hypothetical protein